MFSPQYLLIVGLISLCHGGLLPCFIHNSSWHYEDVINVTSSPSHFACQHLCENTQDCLAFTWNTQGHPHFPKLCTHFRSTANTMDCSDCISGPRSCSCSGEFSCDLIDENLIGIHQAIITEVECQSICYNTHGCNYYTWFGDQGEYSHVCFILSSCPEVDETCQDCFSGPPQCAWSSSTSTTSMMTTTEPHKHSKEYAIVLGGGVADYTVEVFHPDGGANIPDLPNIPTEFALGCTFWTKSGSLIYMDYNVVYSWSFANPSSWIQHGNSSEDLNGCSGVVTSDGETALIASTAGAQHPQLFSIGEGWRVIDIPILANMAACAVGFPQWGTVINTGGKTNGAQVVLLNETGHSMGQLPNMNYPRFEHGCSRVEHNGVDGVMVAGGFSNMREPLNTVEFLAYSGQDSGTWESLPPLPYAVWGMGLKRINGKAYIFGGTGTGSITDLETKDSILRLEEDLGGFWLEYGKMKVPRWYPGVAVTDIEFTHPTTQSPSSSTTAILSKQFTIILGGRDSHGNGLNTIDFFSEDQVDFPDIPTLPEYFNAGCSFMSISGILTIIEGSYTYSWGLGGSDGWVKQESPPESMHSCTGSITSDGETIFIASSNHASHPYLFTPGIGWTALQTKISHNVGACAVGLREGGLVVNIGGKDLGSKAVLMNHLGEIIGELPSMNAARDGHACATVEVDGREGIMVTGGVWDGHKDDTVEFLAFPGVEAFWERLPSLPFAVQGAKLVVLAGKVLHIGGNTQHGLTKQILQFNGLTWTEIDQMDSARYYHGAVIGSTFK